VPRSLLNSSSGDPPDAVIFKECFIIGRWPVFDLLTIDIEVNHPVRPIDLSYRARRDQDPLSGPLVPGIDGDAADDPVGIINEEILDMTYLTVGGMDMVPGDSCDATEMRITLVGLSIGAARITRLCRR
jgi:hypothetical protein